ncbi:hypothetical protein AB1Y20_018606 [Prymnesium parvum]|uniref:Alpha-type protein kinase domain-containing protein n=1 Tax=Prymnesium parvum TaxID=97485 RepID=A0AB34JS00_PRYPA
MGGNSSSEGEASPPAPHAFEREHNVRIVQPDPPLDCDPGQLLRCIGGEHTGKAGVFEWQHDGVAFVRLDNTRAAIRTIHLHPMEMSVNDFILLSHAVAADSGDMRQLAQLLGGYAQAGYAKVDLGQRQLVVPLGCLVEKAPARCGALGQTVYSLIDHASIARGDRGVILGPGADRSCKLRVRVKFDSMPSALNLTPEMFSLHPVPHAETRPAPRATASSAAATASSFELTSLKSALPSILTDDISLISHTHGQARRLERNIVRRELQAAIKYGIKVRANPGRDGSARWRYEYDGVVYITDETSRHEVTSWRVDGKGAAAGGVAPAQVELAGSGCHAVLIVDMSGSMRTADIPGYKSRAAAVYDCLVRDFVKAQISSGAAKDVVVSVVSMGSEAALLIDKHPLDETILPRLQRIAKQRPKGHGNYIPALDKALEVMASDARNHGGLLFFLFSDGAPSDQQEMVCQHGMPVFQFNRKEDPLMGHTNASHAWRCRQLLHARVRRECLDRVRKIGDMFGRDKVIARMVAFGPPDENFHLLEEMAGALPRSEFQKLGLDASNLRTAFSSLSSSMTTMRTAGGGSLLTPRGDEKVDKQQTIDTSNEFVLGVDGWWIYSFEDFTGKYKYDGASRELKLQRLMPDATGLAFLQQPFAEGAERFVFRCSEVSVPEAVAMNWYYRGVMSNQKELMQARRCGLRLVAKEAKAMEHWMQGRTFHETFIRLQYDAAEMAAQFVKLLPSRRSEWNLSFIPTSLYCCQDPSYPGGEAWVLVEPELEGEFFKWNDNAGNVRNLPSDKTSGIGAGTLVEESDEDEYDLDIPIEVNDVPQAFSHFSFEQSRGKKLICDLQGVWNVTDGFLLTDPVVHFVASNGRRHTNGATDKGLEGVKRFFSTHKCNGLCRMTGLPTRSELNLKVP